jgi:hypothetical protein
MNMAAAAILGLLIGAAPAVRSAAYTPLAPPIASATLLVHGATDTVALIGEKNVAVHFTPAEYPDLDITRAFVVVCVFPFNPGPFTVAVRADNPYNFIPATVVDYKYYDPSYIKLEINTQYLTNTIDAADARDHKIRIDFYADR